MRPPVTFGRVAPGPAMQRASRPAPLPNIGLTGGVPTVRASLARAPAIPKRRLAVRLPVQPQQAEGYDWTQNPAALQARARQIEAQQGEVTTHYTMPGRGPISYKEYNRLPPAAKSRVRQSSWEVRANNPNAGNQHNQAKQGCVSTDTVYLPALSNSPRRSSNAAGATQNTIAPRSPADTVGKVVTCKVITSHICVLCYTGMPYIFPQATAF